MGRIHAAAIARRDDNDQLAAMVARGISQLDNQAHPSWDRQLDIPTLNLKDCSNCVLGQLYSRYSARSLRAVGIQAGYEPHSNTYRYMAEAAAEYGFYLPRSMAEVPADEEGANDGNYNPDRTYGLWGRLTVYWRTKVYARRIAAAARN